MNIDLCGLKRKKLAAPRVATLRWTLLLLVPLCFMGGCHAEDDVDRVPNSVRIVGPGIVGSGVYLGNRVVLSNWHMATQAALVDQYLGGTLPDADYTVLLNDNGVGINPFVVGAMPGSAWCITFEDDRDEVVVVDYALVEEASETVLENWDTCIDAYSYNSQLFLFPEVDFDEKYEVYTFRHATTLLYANRELDLAIYLIDHHRAVEEQTVPIGLSETSPRPGQSVSIVGYPQGSIEPIYETCEVVSSSIQPVADPDTLHPSKLIVPSFAINCTSIAPGSSGSPVFDTRTGELMGLVWTSEYDSQENVVVSYVTAVAAWRAYAEQSTEPEHHTQLISLLSSF